jgi:hypothetical protein
MSAEESYKSPPPSPNLLGPKILFRSVEKSVRAQCEVVELEYGGIKMIFSRSDFDQLLAEAANMVNILDTENQNTNSTAHEAGGNNSAAFSTSTAKIVEFNSNAFEFKYNPSEEKVNRSGAAQRTALSRASAKIRSQPSCRPVMTIARERLLCMRRCHMKTCYQLRRRLVFRLCAEMTTWLIIT